MSQLELFSDEPSSASPSDFSQGDLPPYKVRESNRAKHVSIKISVEGEVEVVVPLRFDRAQAAGDFRAAAQLGVADAIAPPKRPHQDRR